SFNATGFSNYQAEETPSGGDSGGGTGSGGGGGGGTGRANFSVEPKKITIKAEVGETIKNDFMIKNPGNVRDKYHISTSGLEGMIKVSEESVIIPFKSEMVVPFEIKVTKEGIHSGRIVVENSNIKKEVIIVVEVKTIESKKEIAREENKTVLEYPEEITLSISEPKYSLLVPLIVITVLAIFLFVSHKIGAKKRAKKRA
ncbi:MAG: hypothetical protein AABW87_03250, partial [Nanoarchaeota archaeon]